MTEKAGSCLKYAPARFAAALAGLVALMTSACAPLQQGALRYDVDPAPGFSEHWFTSFDGARLGLDTYEARSTATSLGPCDSGKGINLANRASACAAAAAVYTADPDVVIIAVHGMNDYAGAFRSAGAWWSAHGAKVYAYDQRGFGRSPNWMIWPDHSVMRKDLETAVVVARERHPHAKIAIVGESMGAAVAITAFADATPPEADALILSGPGLRGWGVLPWYYSASLWVSSHVRPGWVVVPPEGLDIVATDNNAKLREMWFDPYVQKSNRIDSVYGVVSIMEEADQKITQLPDQVPTLMLYGANDQIIPPEGVERAAKRMPRHVKTAYYEKGYHMLMNDLQAESVWSDILAFIRKPDSSLPSGAPAIPFRRETAENR
ncbi:MAG: alpha/beta fold hydrolase [Alphaproteobacteria bacterium]|jgi:acylglycerol lipase|nr:MAG: alpha/beta fold hydrolase [Alphaproteobacteria bacterium]